MKHEKTDRNLYAPFLFMSDRADIHGCQGCESPRSDVNADMLSGWFRKPVKPQTKLCCILTGRSPQIRICSKVTTSLFSPERSPGTRELAPSGPGMDEEDRLRQGVRGRL